MKRIKNRIHGRVIAAVTIVAAFLFGATSITAFAGGYDCTCEHRCTEDCVNPDCELCKIDYTLCCGDETTESEEQEEEPEEKMGPLTPDGNMTLVDDYGDHEKSGKQFITVVTKSGNYFYIIIDRDDNGTETVHFLNMVDEADLLALMDEEAVDQYLASKEAQETPTETVTTEPTETPEDTEPTEETEPQKKSSAGALVIVVIIAIAGAGGYVYFTKIKGKKNKTVVEDPDVDYDEEDEDYLSGLDDEVEEMLADEDEDEDSRVLKVEQSETEDESSDGE